MMFKKREVSVRLVLCSLLVGVASASSASELSELSSRQVGAARMGQVLISAGTMDILKTGNDIVDQKFIAVHNISITRVNLAQHAGKVFEDYRSQIVKTLDEVLPRQRNELIAMQNSVESKLDLIRKRRFDVAASRSKWNEDTKIIKQNTFKIAGIINYSRSESEIPDYEFSGDDAKDAAFITSSLEKQLNAVSMLEANYVKYTQKLINGLAIAQDKYARGELSEADLNIYQSATRILDQRTQTYDGPRLLAAPSNPLRVEDIV
jgi:hypothetical protein